MIETWRDSWFEEGTRLFYMIPRASVDAILPLDIEPRPAEVVRVFVGRLEIITPEMQTEVEHAVRQNDLPTLRKHGRFLEPIAKSLEARFSSASDQATMKAALQAVSPPAAPAPAATRPRQSPGQIGSDVFRWSRLNRGAAAESASGNTERFRVCALVRPLLSNS